MLAHLRARITEKLSRAEIIMLATSGPAGIQMSACASRAVGLRVYTLIPATSEHLVNLEQNPEVAITEDLWRLVGTAQLCAAASPFTEAESRWHQVVEIAPQRFEFLTGDMVQVAETVDIELTDLLEPG